MCKTHLKSIDAVSDLLFEMTRGPPPSHSGFMNGLIHVKFNKDNEMNGADWAFSRICLIFTSYTA